MPLKRFISLEGLVYFLLLENEHYVSALDFLFALAPRELISKFWAQLLRLLLCVNVN